MNAPSALRRLADALAHRAGGEGLNRMQRRLMWVLLVTVPCVVAAGLVMIAALRSYPRDRLASD